jgi:hypothetical protein
VATLTPMRFQKLQRIVEERDGNLLSGLETSSDGRVTIQCSRGHVWHPHLTSVTKVKPSWCPHPECLGERISRAKVQPLIDQQEKRLKQIIDARGGSWVSGQYVNNSTPIFIDCGSGHESVPITPDSLFQGSWCRKCAGKLTANEWLSKMQEHAKLKGGRLISGHYLGARSRHEWECGECGHRWKTTNHSILVRGSWCGVCAQSVEFDLNKYESRARLAVKNLKGEFSSIERTNVSAEGRKSKSRRRVNVTYTCKFGHQNIADLYSLEKGHGCYTCNRRGIREHVCRMMFEHFFGRAFPKKRPSWLIEQDTGYRLELDGYCEELAIAFEYQGQQHYERVDHFQSEKEFEALRRRDKYKRIKASEVGIHLIEVPIQIPLDELQNWLMSTLSQTLQFCFIPIETLDITSFSTGREVELENLRNLAAERGGRLLSDTYVDNQTKLLWQCGKNHPPWYAAPYSVKAGTWCNKCGEDITADKNATDISVIRELIEFRGWTLEGIRKEGGKRYYDITCGNGHRFCKTTTALKKPLGCQYCSKYLSGDNLSDGIEYLQEIAKQNGGKLISKYYLNSRSKLMWECAKGHVWEAFPQKIKEGKSWCRVCAGRKPLLDPSDIAAKLLVEQKAYELFQRKLRHAQEVRDRINRRFKC